MIDNILDILVEFQQQNPNIYIGGSVSLILQNAIPFRIPGDIDIISSQRIHIYDIFNINKSKHILVRKHKHKDLKFELFYNPKAEFVEYNYKETILKISPINEAMQWKLKGKAITKQKHINDLMHYTHD
jgi:hypothetical protein